MKKILCIGDSHISYLSNKEILTADTEYSNKHFTIYNIGAYTAYNMNKHYKIKKVNTIIEKHNDIGALIFSFGEIDIRCHVHKRLDKLKFDENLQLVVNNYIQFLNNFSNKYKVFILLPIFPQLHLDSYDVVGDLLERQKHTVYFNELIKNVGREFNFLEIDSKREYFINSEKDKIHIDPKKVWNQIEKMDCLWK